MRNFDDGVLNRLMALLLQFINLERVRQKACGTNSFKHELHLGFLGWWHRPGGERQHSGNVSAHQSDTEALLPLQAAPKRVLEPWLQVVHRSSSAGANFSFSSQRLRTMLSGFMCRKWRRIPGLLYLLRHKKKLAGHSELSDHFM